MYKDDDLYRRKIDEMVEVYKKVAPLCWRQGEALRRVVGHKASSFFITPHAAYCAIRDVYLGRTDKITHRIPSMKRMYEEIYRRVLDMSRSPKYSGWSLTKLCEEVVEQEAPEFYLSPETFRGILCRERRKLRKGGRDALR